MLSRDGGMCILGCSFRRVHSGFLGHVLHIVGLVDRFSNDKEGHKYSMD